MKVINVLFKKQTGQAMPIIIGGLLLACISLLLVYNHTSRSNERSIVMNAADAAAYSLATHTARQFNFLAYSNRSIVETHATVGHMVGMMSWSRWAVNMEPKLQVLAKASNILPYIGKVIDKVISIGIKLTNKANKVAEKVYPMMIAAADVETSLHYVAHQAIRAEAFSDQLLGGIQDEVGKLYGENIRINNESDIVKVLTQDSLGMNPAALISEIGNQYLGLSGVMDVRTTGSKRGDDGDIAEIKDLILKSTDRSQWITGKPVRHSFDPGWVSGWRRIGIRKQASTELQEKDGALDWYAKDRIDTFNWGKWRWEESTKGSARASSLAANKSSYKGVRGYTQLNRELFYKQASKKNSPGWDEREGYEFIVIATKPQDQYADPQGTTSAGRDITISSDGDGRHLAGTAAAPNKLLSSIVRSKAVYERPLKLGSGGGFDRMPNVSGGRDSEYANLYNPFWYGTLITNDNVLGLFK